MTDINYIICTHNDLDGFCCGAILLRKYPSAKVFFATSNSLFKTFYRIKHSLTEDTENHLIIADISLNGKHIGQINQALRYIRKEFHLTVTWIDHHEWPPEEYLLKNMKRILDPTQRSAAILVQQYTDPEENFDFINFAEGIASIEDYEYWKTVIRNVCNTKIADKKLEPVLHSFSKLERSKVSDEFNDIIREISDEEFDGIEIFITLNKRKFAVLDLHKITYKVSLYKEVFRISKLFNCDFIVIIFENEEISVYNIDNVSLSFLADYGAVGHLEKGAVHIPTPYKKSGVFGFQRPITVSEFADVLKENL